MVHQSSSRASIESASSETMIILESDDTVIHMNEGWKQVPEPEELDVERRLRRKYPMWWKVWRGLALGFLGMIFLV